MGCFQEVVIVSPGPLGRKDEPPKFQWVDYLGQFPLPRALVRVSAVAWLHDAPDFFERCNLAQSEPANARCRCGTGPSRRSSRALSMVAAGLRAEVLHHRMREYLLLRALMRYSRSQKLHVLLRETRLL